MQRNASVDEADQALPVADEVLLFIPVWHRDHDQVDSPVPGHALVTEAATRDLRVHDAPWWFVIKRVAHGSTSSYAVGRTKVRHACPHPLDVDSCQVNLDHIVRSDPEMARSVTPPYRTPDTRGLLLAA